MGRPPSRFGTDFSSAMAASLSRFGVASPAVICFPMAFFSAAFGSCARRRPVSEMERIIRVQINVSARHGHLSPASQSKITTKVSRLKRYFNGLTALNVTVDLQNPALPAVEIVASAEHFHQMVSHEVSAHLWRSVDGAVQKLEQQLRKHKEKVRDHKHVETARKS